jgi:23S rRNA pseudouridine2605 synthase
LNKFIAHAGICSRREADMHIKIGSVKVNNKVMTEMGYKVKPTDEVSLTGSDYRPKNLPMCCSTSQKGLLPPHVMKKAEKR